MKKAHISHKTKHIIHKDMEADVDEKIADLILDLWKLDICTSLSCQDNVPKNYVWIMFPHSIEAEKFMDLVADYDEDFDSIYQSMLNQWDGIKNKWIYATSVDDCGMSLIYDEDDNEIIGEEFDGEHKFMFSLSVRFPVKHLKFVEAQIKKALESKSEKEMIEKEPKEELNKVK